MFALLLLLGSFHVDYATYLGGSGDERVGGIAADSAGSAYVAGTTDSPGSSTGFVTKLNAGGSAVVWSVRLANMSADGIGVDAGGNVYALAHDSNSISSVVKVSPGGERTVYSKSLGILASALAVDSAGNAYAVGGASGGLTATAGAYQASVTPGTCHYGAGVGLLTGPCADAFVIKLGRDGSIAYATYLGGSGPDQARAAAVDSQGDVWITGDTVSPDFPVTAGALQSSFHGEVDLGPLRFGDAFVAKLDPTGGKLLYSTYLGGAAPEAGMAIAVDSSGAAYVAGGTQSADFPTTPGAYRRTYSGGSAMPSLSGNAFAARFSASGALVYSTFVPGPQATDIAVNAQGQAYLASSGLSVLSADGSNILHSAGLSGSLALDAQSAVYLAGTSLGYVFFPTAGAAQTQFGGGVYDATVVKIDFAGPPSAWISSIVNAASLRSGTPQNYPVYDLAPGEIITIFGSGFDGRTRLLFDGVPAPILYAQEDQINAVVPFEVNGPATAILLEAGGETFGPGRMQVFDAVPGLFTWDGSGRGPAAVLNQDGTVNSAANPAPRGSVISVFLTGAGRMSPAQADGSLGPLSPPFPAVALGAACSIGQVLYAGAAPGLVAGAVQVNVRISEDVTPGGRVPIVVYIGNYASGCSGDTTVAVR